MSKGYLNNWIRISLLLAALAAGTVVSQFVPKYQEESRTVTYPSKAASVTGASGQSSHGVSGVDADGRHITLVRSKS